MTAYYLYICSCALLAAAIVLREVRRAARERKRCRNRLVFFSGHQWISHAPNERRYFGPKR
jgi:hypothetical protein